MIRNGRTILPARFVAEKLGATVTWDAAKPNEVVIKSRNNGEQKANPESPYGKTEIVPTTDPAETLGYCLYIPNNAGTEALPLIVYLHGGSLCGDDPSRIPAADGLPNYVQSGKLGDVRAYVLSPQCPTPEQSSGRGASWKQVTTQVFALIDKICEAYPVDRQHVILTGRSMGGAGTWSLACMEPDRFSCVIPMTGSIQNTESNRNALSQKPVWAFVGGKDTTVPPESSMEFIDALKPINPNAKLTLFEDAGHSDVSRMAWLDESIGLLAWALAQLEGATVKLVGLDGMDDVIATQDENGTWTALLPDGTSSAFIAALGIANIEITGVTASVPTRVADDGSKWNFSVDDTTYVLNIPLPKPLRLIETWDGTATPASADGKIAAVACRMPAAEWFNGDVASFTKATADLPSAYGTLGVTADKTTMIFTPTAAAAGQTLTVRIYARNAAGLSEPVTATITVGVLPVQGDVNGDGVVNAKDVTALRRYIAGGYGTAINESLSDINSDGAINAKDVTTLRRYLAGGYGIEL